MTATRARVVAGDVLRLDDLVIDYDVYPRHAIDRVHVAGLARAIEAGEQLPPLIVDRRSKRVVDGFHRAAAHRQRFGDQAQVEVELRDYETEADLIEDAVRLNARHGRRLDAQDQVRSALMLERLGRDTNRIAVALSTTPARVEQLKAKIVVVEGQPIPAKPIARLAEAGRPRELTAEQATVMRSSSGHGFAQACRQMTREIKSGLVEMTPEHVALASELRDAITEAIAEASRPVDDRTSA